MLLFYIPAFLFGLLLGSFLPFLPCSIFLLLITGAIVLAWFERTLWLTRAQGLMLYVALLSGVGYWSAFEWAQGQPNLLELAGTGPVQVTGTVVEPVQHAPNRVIMVLEVLAIGEGADLHPAWGRLRLTWRGPDRKVVRGDHLSVTARIRPPFGTINPGGFDYGDYLRRQGIHAVATVSHSDRIRVIKPENVEFFSSPWRLVDQWRDRVRQAALKTLEAPSLGLYLGMIIGEQSFISPEIRDDFMATGTVHIISISGSHLGLLAFLSFFLVKALSRHMPPRWLETLSRRITPTRLAVGATIPLVIFYTLLAGSPVATVRSLMMVLLFLLAVWLGHERKILVALAVAAAVVTVHDPHAIFDISFQLSYVSVLAIALAFRWMEKTQNDFELAESKTSKIRHWLGQYFLMTVAATLAALPLVAYYFNQVAWLGLMANLVVVPLVGFIVVPLGLLSAVWVLVMGAESLPLGWLNQMVLEFLVDMVSLLAQIPGGEWHVASPSILGIVVFYVLLVITVGWWRGSPWQWGSVAALVLVVAWWAWSPRTIWNDEEMRVAFLDVGQGDATVIELPGGETLLIDGGAAYERWDFGRAVVGPYLWDRGIRRIDHVLATHPQLDHIGGLAWVVRKFGVGEFWSNGIIRTEPFYQKLREAVKERGLNEQIGWKGRDIVRGGSCRMQVLNPSRGGSSEVHVQPMSRGGTLLNNLSIVVDLTCGGHSFLFTADAEIEALGNLIGDPDGQPARVVKIPHHGAKSSLNRGWINRLEAEVAVVSAGRGNRYGHPAPAVLKVYEQKGIKIFRTDRDGAVWITANPFSPTFTIHTAREQLLRPVHFDASLLNHERKNLIRIWNKWSGAI